MYTCIYTYVYVRTRRVLFRFRIDPISTSRNLTLSLSRFSCSPCVLGYFLFYINFFSFFSFFFVQYLCWFLTIAKISKLASYRAIFLILSPTPSRSERITWAIWNDVPWIVFKLERFFFRNISFYINLSRQRYSTCYSYC